jgi:hypothetical protein
MLRRAKSVRLQMDVKDERIVSENVKVRMELVTRVARPLER